MSSLSMAGVPATLAADAAVRMKNEVALVEPDLVLWQVGTNDALAYVPSDEFASTVKEQIDWLKAHRVDIVLVGIPSSPRRCCAMHTTSNSQIAYANWGRRRT